MWKNFPRVTSAAVKNGNGSISMPFAIASPAPRAALAPDEKFTDSHAEEEESISWPTANSTVLFANPLTTGLTGVVSGGLHQYPNQYLLVQEILRQQNRKRHQPGGKKPRIHDGCTAYSYVRKGPNGSVTPKMCIVARGTAYDFNQDKQAHDDQHSRWHQNSYYDSGGGARQYSDDERFFHKVIQHNIVGIGTTMAIFSAVGIGHVVRNKVFGSASGSGDMLNMCNIDFGRMCVTTTESSNLRSSWGFAPRVLQVVTHSPKPLIVYESNRRHSTGDLPQSQSSSTSSHRSRSSSLAAMDEFFAIGHNHYHLQSLQPPSREPPDHPTPSSKPLENNYLRQKKAPSSYFRSIFEQDQQPFGDCLHKFSPIGDGGSLPNLSVAPDSLWPEELDHPYSSRPFFARHLFPPPQDFSSPTNPPARKCQAEDIHFDNKASSTENQPQPLTTHQSAAVPNNGPIFHCALERTEIDDANNNQTPRRCKSAHQKSSKGFEEAADMNWDLSVEEKAVLSETNRIVQLKEDLLAARSDLCSINVEAEAAVVNQIGVELMRDRLWPEAVANFRRASRMGSTEATYNLALCYKNGHGTQKKPTMSVKLWREAAEEGHAGAAYNYGVALLKGYGGVYTPEQHKQAKEWIQRAANAGLSQACTFMGINDMKNSQLNAAADSHSFLSSSNKEPSGGLLPSALTNSPHLKSPFGYSLPSMSTAEDYLGEINNVYSSNSSISSWTSSLEEDERAGIFFTATNGDEGSTCSKRSEMGHCHIKSNNNNPPAVPYGSCNYSASSPILSPLTSCPPASATATVSNGDSHYHLRQQQQ